MSSAFHAERIHAQAQFLWAGGVTTSSATARARVPDEGSVVRLVVSQAPDFSMPVYSAPDTAIIAVNNRVVDLRVTGLSASTLHYYHVEIDGVPDLTMQGSFSTMHPYGPSIFTVALGSCANTASNHAVFQTINGWDPLLFLQMGDFHYSNIAVNDVVLFRAAYEAVLGSANQAALYRSTAIDYVWDDHDYGPNNSDSTAPGRLASRLTYQEYVPHYPLAAGTGNVPIHHAYAVGRVRFIVTDCRSARSPASATDNTSKTMLGMAQKAWFKSELLAAEGVYPLKVWVNSLPWIGATGDDGWHLYTNERREIADFIKDNGITGLCMLSGDAHMLAIDDGTNSDYATGGGAAFPVFHAAALDRTGSAKGGPYSHGAYPGGGQFGLMTVTDSGGSIITVQWSGRNANNTIIVQHSFSVTAEPLPCECSHQGDIAANDFVLNVLDVVGLIDHVFRGGQAPPKDLNCPHMHRGDVNCDQSATVLDVVGLINTAFRGDAAICNPCQGTFPLH